jgi:hypothetical protein
MSEYRDGFEDGVRFTREVIVENLRDWASEADEDGDVIDWIADRIELGIAESSSDDD